MKRRIAPTLVVLALAAGACQKKEAPPPPPPPPAAPATGTASLDVTVRLAGKPPEMPLTKRDADPFCARTPTKDEEVVVRFEDRLMNVLVRFTKGVTGTFKAPAYEAGLDQAGCMYRPRVQGLMAGQTLTIRNSDKTLHNVHTYKGASTVFNVAQVPGLPPVAKTFEDGGEILRFKCDVHPGMTAYVAVLNDPFFCVTGNDGMCRLLDVPAGTYTLEVWHERYGTQSKEITVAADKQLAAAFTFDANAKK